MDEAREWVLYFHMSDNLDDQHSYDNLIPSGVLLRKSIASDIYYYLFCF